MSNPRVVLIAGPTASGKSALALALAERLDGVVINADSMQLYRELRVLSARPSPEDEVRAPHRLYGDVAGSDPFSVGRWLERAVREIDAARAADRTAILVGGTGLYFRALMQGLASVPDIPTEIRARWRQVARERPPEELFRILSDCDPETAARIRPSDPQRIVRALEVFEATGRPLARWQAGADQPALSPVSQAMRMVLTPDRTWLAERIARRTSVVIEQGAVEEVHQLRKLRLSAELPVMKAIGVAEISALLEGRSTVAAALDLMSRRTRQYAKRQATWIRGQMTDWPKINPAGVDVAEILTRLSSTHP
ncbi:MAG: tRNA (adenosine(37)-N6)-dimethylallyltransferase MiaA [Hyphomicrobiaceae bacterium]